MAKTPWKWLQHFPRYFAAIAYRIEKLPASSISKDLALTDDVDRFWQQYVSQKSAHEHQSVYDPELDLFRWMIEEYRVSLFAQTLGTSQTVSAKRLEKQFNKVTRL
jgi:ATP-dependent helicase HrpA